MKVAVVGLGIAGLSIAERLAARGHAVDGFEQFEPLHKNGSSHGDTRIFRHYPFEGDVYVSMAHTSYDGWKRWSAEAGTDLFVECGGLYASPPGEDMAARMLAIGAHDISPLTPHDVEARFPYLTIPKDWQAAFVASDGYVRPNQTLQFLIGKATAHGASLHFSTEVEAIDVQAATVKVQGQVQHYDAIVLSAGSWLVELVPSLFPYLKPERRVMGWYRSEGGEAVNGTPVFRIGRQFYGMPTPSGDLKAGMNDHYRQAVDPNTPGYVNDSDAAHIDKALAVYTRNIRPHAHQYVHCLYTMTPDGDFVMDKHPLNDKVILFSSCSGHGFKYAPAYGDIVADVLEGKPRREFDEFSLRRFDKQ